MISRAFFFPLPRKRGGEIVEPTRTNRRVYFVATPLGPACLRIATIITASLHWFTLSTKTT